MTLGVLRCAVTFASTVSGAPNNMPVEFNKVKHHVTGKGHESWIEISIDHSIVHITTATAN